MLTEDHLQRLALFEAQAQRLLGSSFLATMLGTATGFQCSGGITQPTELTVRGPTEESVAAFVLTLRFFLHDGREKISFRAMAELYEAVASPTLAAQFRQLRDSVNRFLDSDTIVEFDGEKITRRRVVDVFLNGGLAHAERLQSEIYARWEQVPLLLPMLRNEFVATLSGVSAAIRNAQELNEALRAA